MLSVQYFITFTLLLPSQIVGKQPYIINGTLASIKSNKFVCAIVIKDHNKEYFKAGAAIVGLYWTITAASVVDIVPESQINVGNLYIRSNSERWKKGRKHVADKIYKHPKYNPITYDNDIAFVKVKTPFNGPYEKPVKLAGSRYKEEIHAYMFGWGTDSFYDSTLMEMLQQTVIVIVNNTVCKRTFNKSVLGKGVTNGMLCSVNEQTGDCFGDGGGPVVQHHDILIGIISWGRTCGQSDYPSVLTRISKQASFIESIDIKFRIGFIYKNFP
ncbi:hypothetical protein ILUMI_04179 [Ignelater luminosus]|uniref:Peptidase S1 domain-containing protein n=1 Tax=Ignelater luminosus TaxID=2038154 RepID=A0A8K0DD35_IGNLU|nr:hypothetical protein ILUMI_04179 [Ignelater luminosus]